MQKRDNHVPFDGQLVQLLENVILLSISPDGEKLHPK
jgi:hypothetical protein